MDGEDEGNSNGDGGSDEGNSNGEGGSDEPCKESL